MDSSLESSFSPDSDFFDAGGHSLLLAKLTSALKDETGVALTIPELLECPTLEGMAMLVEEAKGIPTGDVAAAAGAASSSSPSSAVAGLASGGAVEDEPVVLQKGVDGVMPVVVRPAAVEDGGVAGVALAASGAGGARAAGVVDLPAEARRLDQSIFPAGSRKSG